MKTIFTFLSIMAIATMVVTNVAYAKQTTSGAENSTTSHTKLTKEERTAVKEAKKTAKAEEKAAKKAAVKKVYFYAEGAVAPFDYETKAWAQLNVNAKKNSVTFNGHNLTAGKEVSLSYAGTVIGKATVNTDGDVHMKATLPAGTTTIDPVKFSVTDGTVTMTGTKTRLKGVETTETTEE